METITVPALTEQLDTVLTFVLHEMEALHCSPKICNQISIAVEEIFVNIAHYAYRPDVGDATIRCQICVQDRRKLPLNFWIRASHMTLCSMMIDISLSADERRIGGLGILMVKT